MDKKTQRIILIVVGVAAVCVVVYYIYYRKNSSKEGFTGLAAGANDNIGHLLDDSYDLVPGADNEIPAPHFADIVNQGDQSEYIQPEPDAANSPTMRPMERLHRVQGKSLMPRVSIDVTPFNVDVANPTSHKYMVNTPRVTTALKSRFKDYSLASFVRGDVAITYHPTVPLIAKTVQGRDDLRLDGLFTPYFNALYNKYTGKEFKSLPVKVAGAGQAAGYGGASGGTIMDHYE